MCEGSWVLSCDVRRSFRRRCLLSSSVSVFGVGMLFRVMLEIVQQCCVMFPASLDSRWWVVFLGGFGGGGGDGSENLSGDPSFMRVCFRILLLGVSGSRDGCLFLVVVRS
ncbi:hypothetical protein P8452_03022 [Trifolium repens]|nr:hypothetical protein P8452_03022 [Trifolium repens]